MCLIILAIEASSDYPLIVAANRDEFHERPTAGAHFWGDHSQLLAGRDLKEGGTWMGITRDGRFAAVTNFREETPTRAPRSRGELTHQFLLGDDEPEAYLDGVASRGDQYRGFNLLVGSPRHGYFYYANRTQEFRALSEGVYGLSNDVLDAPWPKVLHGVRVLTENAEAPTVETLIEHLASRDLGEGLDPQLDITQRTASTFIEGEVYGTRSSTVMIQTREGSVEFAEQSYLAAGRKGEMRNFRFQLDADLANASSL
ncbi:MAG: NRDE family protein [Gammaproteobacteria bacterium]|nr:NRDE family protein [Gammaproteobacteria bacterium]